MKKYIKVLLALCIIISGLFQNVAYAEETKPFDYDDDSIIAIVQGILTEVDAFSDEELDYYIDNSLGITKTVCEQYRELRENDTLGEFVEFMDSTIENTENSAIVTITAAYEKADVQLVVTYMEISSSIVPTDIELETISSASSSSKLDSIKNAALNTVMGICIVVVMLMLISFIISLFKYIPKLQDKFTKKKYSGEMNLSKTDDVVTQIIEKEEHSSNENDKSELVAVITAAICAASGAKGDSFVVRSIRKIR